MRMKVTFLSVGIALSLAVGGFAPASAEEPASSPSIRPAEIYGCTYRAGKGMADLMPVVDRWNAWMDRTSQNDYFAYLLVPLYHSTDRKFDVLWVGGWPSGAAMGAGLQRWVTEGGELSAEFDKVVDCPTVTNFAVMDLQKASNPPASGPVEFSDCKVVKGREFADALGAVRAWVSYQAEHGIASDRFILFPAFGESRDASYSFKWVTTSDWAALGKSYDQYGNGGGYQKAQELFDGLLDCDSSRLYVSRRIREMQMGETKKK
jgi:hypothetical protein